MGKDLLGIKGHKNGVFTVFRKWVSLVLKLVQPKIENQIIKYQNNLILFSKSQRL